MRRWEELIGAAALLTRLPVGGLARRHGVPAACIWAYPLVGAGVGALGAAVHALARLAGLSAGVAALCALAATVLATGALHEDGLADLADGIGGGRTRERKLAIMRDSRIGSYGALALGFSLALRGVALAQQPHPEYALVAAGTLGRGVMLLPLLLLRPARPDGLGAMMQPVRWRRGVAGLALAALASWADPAAGLAAAAAGAAVLLTARRHLGGYTGDVLGAVEQAAECAALAAA